VVRGASRCFDYNISYKYLWKHLINLDVMSWLGIVGVEAWETVERCYEGKRYQKMSFGVE
jgi:hypothetical protein